LSSFGLLGVGFVFTSKVGFFLNLVSSFLGGFFSVFLLRRVFFSILVVNSGLSFFSGFSGLSVDRAVGSDEVFSSLSIASEAVKILVLDSSSFFSDSAGVSELDERIRLRSLRRDGYHRFQFVEGVDVVSAVFDLSLEELDFSGDVLVFSGKFGDVSGQLLREINKL